LEIKPKLLRVTTVALSLDKLLEGQLEYMSDFFEVTATCSPSETIPRIEEREAVKIYPITMYRGISPLRDLISIFKLTKLLIRLKPDIIHSHTPKAGLVAMSAAFLCNSKVRIHTVAGLPLESETGLKRKLLILIEKTIYRIATKIYPNSYSLLNFIKENNLIRNENKLKVICNGSSNGIDLSHFYVSIDVKKQAIELKLKLGIKDTDFIFTFVGRIVKDKGIEELVEAFQYVSENRDNVKLLIVGPFENERDPISEEVKSILKSNIDIMSVGLQMDIRPYLALTNVFVFPSYREGLPNVVLQAGAFKLPTIGTNITGTTDIIEDNVNGLIANVADSISLYQLMNKLYHSESERARLGSNLHKTVTEKYKQKLVWEALKNEYFNLLDENK